ncbi:sulfotransferase [Geomonas oryzisoli]|uniref:Sulfotransferase n=1 Tax=Geomonas oryzisoli TaxID=2847992 RepID=A0ABX8J2I9_9BACT|nr:sulfotransferase [Geomonas oryzisoli]QWV92463.1 sulfotransferase [Geomonas oryzisoli]
MNRRNIDKAPVFVIGSYRSGTSVLTWCLGQHPQILALEETNWIAYLSVYLDTLFLLGTVNADHSNISSIGVTEDEFCEFFGQGVNNFISNYLDRYLEAAKARSDQDPRLKSALYNLAHGRGQTKDRWVDGTPENSHFVYGLNRLYPGAKFIHILRTPHDVAKSLQNFSKAGGRDYSEEEAYRTWMRLVNASAEAEAALGPDKVTRVLYSDLVDRPKEVIAHCLDFIGLPFDETCLLPLHKKINSSGDTTISSKPDFERTYIAEASRLYQDLLQLQPRKTVDPERHMAMKDKFLEFAKQFRLEEIDRLSRWGQELDAEIREKDCRILDLQKEVEELGTWGRSLDATIAEMEDEIATLRSQLQEKDDTLPLANGEAPLSPKSHMEE